MSIPKGALVLGMDTPIFNVSPTTADVGSATDTGTSLSLYAGTPYSAPATKPDYTTYTNVNGSLTMPLGGSVCSVNTNYQPGLIPLLPGSTGFYVEFTTVCGSASSDNYNAVWLLPVEHANPSLDHDPTQVGGFERWLEIDVSEANTLVGSSLQSLINWSGVYSSGYANATYNDYGAAPAVNFSVPNRFGVSFDPIKELVTYWINDKQVFQKSISTFPRMFYTHNYYLLITSASHGGHTAYTHTLINVQAWKRTLPMPQILLDDPGHATASDQLFAGTVANDGTGDPAKTVGAKIKQWAADINTMTTDIYARVPRSYIIDKMRAAMAAAVVKNGVTSQPLIAPPAWTTGTTYYTGQAVTSSGNTYICLGGNVAAGSTAPTGTGAALFSDGGCTWYYWGLAYTSSPIAPTVGIISFASRYTGLFWATTACTYSVGSTRIQDSTNFLFYGCAANDGGGANGSYSWDQKGLIGGVSFMTEAPSFQIVLNGNVAPSLNIYVDGTPVTLGMTIYGTGQQFFQMVFPDRRARRITVEMQTNLFSSFYGVLMNDTVSHVWAPSISNHYKLSIVGTSYFAGSGNHPVTASLGLGSQIARYLGAEDYWIDRLGAGTGYVVAGSTSIFGSPARIAALVASAPDVVIVSGGGINDGAAGTTLVTEQAAVLAYLTAVRLALPNVIILVIGSESGASGPSTAVLNMETAVANAVTAFADSNTYYLPQSATARKAWISGTGFVTGTNGSGNSDYLISPDSIHPVQAGVNYLAYQEANAIRALINSLV